MAQHQTFYIEIDTDNAAFEDGMASELGRILRDTADRIEAGEMPPFGLTDFNGNTCGRVEVRQRWAL